MGLLDPGLSPWLLAAVLLAAALYSSVGHGGGSGYLAAMALFGVAPGVMKPAALALNVFVAALVLARLARAGHLDLRLLAPLAAASVPCALVGGAYTLTAPAYRWLVGGALLLAAAHLLLGAAGAAASRRPPLWATLPAGGLLGLVSGLTGVGGGIFLSPLLLLMGWATMRVNAAVSAAFILVNSLAALAGHAAAGGRLPEGLAALVAAALGGALIGSELAVRRLGSSGLRRVLGVVLALAGGKMIAGA